MKRTNSPFYARRTFILTLLSFVAVAALVTFGVSARRVNRERALQANNSKTATGVKPVAAANFQDKNPNAPDAFGFTATLTDNTASPVAPGSPINYTAVLSNTSNAGESATNVLYSGNVDNTTQLTGTVQVSPATVNDTFGTTVLGNVSIDSGAFSVLTNDYMGQNPAGTITAFSATSAQGGNVTVDADGTFTYDPPAGYEGADSFTYTLSNAAAGSVGTVSLTVSGMVWFIQNGAAACTTIPASPNPGGCGRLSNPFSSLAAFQALNNGTGNNPAVNDNIFVYEHASAYTGGVTLLGGQKFIGQDATDTLATISGLTTPSGSPVFPAMNTGAPATTLSGAGITLNGTTTSNVVRGMTIADTAGTTKISGTSFGTLTVGKSGSPDVTLSGTGRALNLTTGSFAATSAFTSVAATSSTTQGINLVSVGGTVAFGSTTTSGTTNQGILVNTSAVNINYGNTSVATSGGTGVNLTTNTGTHTFADLDITPNSGQRGIHATSNTAQINSTSGTITTAGSAIGVEIVGTSNVSRTPLNMTLDKITVGGTPTSGIILTNTSAPAGTAGFAVIGAGGTCGTTGTTLADCTGGSITNSSADGVVLTDVERVVLKSFIIGNVGTVDTEAADATNSIAGDGISMTRVTAGTGGTHGLALDNVKIARTAHHGINGGGGGNVGMSVLNSEIINAGDSTVEVPANPEDAISFGSGFPTTDQLTGTVLIQNSTFAAMADHGFQVENAGTGILNMTVENVTMKNNHALTFCSGGPCEGSAIQIVTDGSSVAGGTGPTANLTVRQLTATNIDQDVLDLIADPGGNINVTVGDPANAATNGITANCPNGDNVLRFNSGSPDSDDIATFNFNVRNVIVQQMAGTLVIFKAGNTMTGTFRNSTLDANNLGNTLAARGIEITADGDASLPATEIPLMTILIDNVTLNRIGGDGIQAFMTDVNSASARLDLTVTNCNIGTVPGSPGTTGFEIGRGNASANEGIEVRNGVTDGTPGQLYLNFDNNNIRNFTSASGSAQGVDIDAESDGITHVTIKRNDVLEALGATDYTLDAENFPAGTSTTTLCADFGTDDGGGDGANTGVDAAFNQTAPAVFNVEGGTGALGGNNPGVAITTSGAFGTATCTMPNVPSGAFFALRADRSPREDLALVPGLSLRQAGSADELAARESVNNHRSSNAKNSTARLSSNARIVAKAEAAPVQNTEASNASEARRSHHAQFNRSRSMKASVVDKQPLVPTFGEPVGPITIPTLQAGKSVTIKYTATVLAPPTARQASHQVNVTYTGGSGSTQTDDPDVAGAANPTITAINTLVTWNGVTDTDWNLATNWTPPAGGTQYAPGVSNPAVNDVVIPNVGNQPNIGTTEIGIFSLNLSNGRTLTIGAARTLTIGGSPGGDLTVDGIITGGFLNLGTGTHVINNAGGTGSIVGGNQATVLSGSTVTLNNDLQMSSLTVNAGGNMNITSRTLSLARAGAALNIPGGATFTTTGSTVVLNGGVGQTIAGIAYNNLTINNSIGLNVTGVTLQGNATVNGVLTLTSSDLSTGAFTLTHPNTTLTTGVSDVIGTVTRSSVVAATPLTFGHPDNRITITVPGTLPTSLTMVIAKAAPATYATAVSRNYQVTNLGGSGFTATLRLHYLDTELNGNAESPTVNFNLRKGPGWGAVVPTARDTAGASNWLENSAVTSFSQWTFSFLAPTASGGAVTGRIVDDNGVPVEGAVVRLSGAQNRKFITDANGFYRFDNVETNGFYNVTPSRVNYTFSPAVISFSQIGETTNATFGASATGASVNPLDTPEYFVRQHYLDFLSREPDEAGFNFWSDQIIGCGDDADCVDRRMQNVSAAYFLSIEFQETGGLVDGLYRASYGRRPSYGEFKPDAAAVAPGLVVGNDGWLGALESGKAAFVNAFVQRPAFQTLYGNLSNDAYVDALIANTGVSFTSAERSELVSGLNGGMTRAAVLRAIVENGQFVNAKRNQAFVMMEYFGYLRREPDADGYQFWLHKLNEFNGNFEQAEMVKSFIISGEYRGRFPR